MQRVSYRVILLALSCAAMSCADPRRDPDNEENMRSPNYRGASLDEPSSGERGNIMITEINWAGSVRNDGVYDPEDVFIELRNMHPRPINLSGWHLIIEGDYVQTIRLPRNLPPMAPNAYYVIAAKESGAFPNADLYLPELRLGKNYVQVNMRDNDLRLIEQAGSDSQRVFTGHYDTQSVRSMERVQLIFANQGGMSRVWHAYSLDIGFATINPEYRDRTLASPGVSNSEDYSGSTAGGIFD